LKYIDIQRIMRQFAPICAPLLFLPFPSRRLPVIPGAATNLPLLSFHVKTHPPRKSLFFRFIKKKSNLLSIFYFVTFLAFFLQKCFSTKPIPRLYQSYTKLFSGTFSAKYHFDSFK